MVRAFLISHGRKIADLSWGRISNIGKKLRKGLGKVKTKKVEAPTKTEGEEAVREAERIIQEAQKEKGIR
jgi:hypothetical protein